MFTSNKLLVYGTFLPLAALALALLVLAPDAHAFDPRPGTTTQTSDEGSKYKPFLPYKNRTPGDMLAEMLSVSRAAEKRGSTKPDAAFKWMSQELGVNGAILARILYPKPGETPLYKVYDADGKQVIAAGINPADLDDWYWKQRDAAPGEQLVCAEVNGKRACLSTWCGNPEKFADVKDYGPQEPPKPRRLSLEELCAKYKPNALNGPQRTPDGPFSWNDNTKLKSGCFLAKPRGATQ